MFYFKNRCEGDFSDQNYEKANDEQDFLEIDSICVSS